jgi:hypothetical protein
MCQFPLQVQPDERIEIEKAIPIITHERNRIASIVLPFRRSAFCISHAQVPRVFPMELSILPQPIVFFCARTTITKKGGNE